MIETYSKTNLLRLTLLSPIALSSNASLEAFSAISFSRSEQNAEREKADFAGGWRTEATVFTGDCRP